MEAYSIKKIRMLYLVVFKYENLGLRDATANVKNIWNMVR